MNAKLVSKGLAIAIIFVLAMSVASSSFAKGRGNSPESSEGWFEVRLVPEKTVYDDDTSTWTYQVVETGKGKDLSHWVLDLGDCTVIGADPQSYEMGKDKSTKVDHGIKWNVSDDFENGYFSVTVDGVVGTDMVNFATKAGRSVDYGKVVGPTCDQDQGGGGGTDPGV